MAPKKPAGHPPDEKVVVATNRRALHRYKVQESFEAGLVLQGAEVKSIRAGKANLEGAFARVVGGEVWLHNLHVQHYAMARPTEVPPDRPRKLLLKAAEIRKLLGATQQKGTTLVPLELYFRRGWAKIAIGVATAKLGPDRRDEIKKRDLERESGRRFKS